MTKTQKYKLSEKHSRNKFPEDLRYIILLSFVTVALYFQVINFGKIEFDEIGLISDELNVTSISGALEKSFLTDAFYTSEKGEFYRPLQSLSYIIDYKINKDNPIVFHCTNLLLHLITILLLYVLLKSLKVSRFPAFAGALIFAIHPMLASAIAWIPARGDLLLGLFGVILLLSFIKSAEKPSVLYILVTGLVFLMTLFSKETGVVFPVVLIIYYYQEKRTFDKIILTQLIFWIFIIAGYLLIRSKAVTSLPETYNLKNVFFGLQVIPVTFVKFLLPLNLSTMPVFELSFIISGVILLFALILFVIFKKDIKFRWIIFGLLWFVLFSIPAAASRHKLGSNAFDYLEHRTYIAYIGLIIGLIQYLSNITNINTGKIIRYSGIPIVMILAAISFYHTLNYAGSDEFFKAALKANESNVLAMNNYAGIKYKKGELSEALNLVSNAIRIRPDYYEAFNNRGLIRLKQNETGQAIEDLNNAIKKAPNYYEAFLNRAIVYESIGDFSKAINDYDYILMHDNENHKVKLQRGMAKLRNNDSAGAVNDCNEVIAKQPNFSQGYFSRGWIYSNLGIKAVAMNDYTKAIWLDENNMDAVFNRGLLYYENGDWKKAETDFLTVLYCEPSNTEVTDYLLNIKRALNDNDAGVALINKAIENSPETAEYYYQKAGLLIASGKFMDAIPEYTNAIRYKNNYSEAYNNRANLYIKAGEYHSAIADADSAIKLNPGYAKAFYNKGVALYFLEKYENALSDLNMAIKLNDKFADAYYYSGLINIKTGNKLKAIRDFKESRKLGNKSAEAELNKIR